MGGPVVERWIPQTFTIIQQKDISISNFSTEVGGEGWCMAGYNTENLISYDHGR